MLFFDDTPMEFNLGLRRWIVVIIADVAILTQMCLAMYWASQQPDALTSVFLKSFLSMSLPTLVLTLIAMRVLRPAQEPAPEAVQEPAPAQGQGG